MTIQQEVRLYDQEAYARQSACLGSLCLELRKSVLKAKYGIDDDEKLTWMVFVEVVACKEQQ